MVKFGTVDIKIIKIDPYHFELTYTVSKLGCFLRHSVLTAYIGSRI